VFIEVRYRKSSLFGSAMESITEKKQHKIGLAAQHYICQHQLHNRPCRFDVVAITGKKMESIDWITDAFQPKL